MQGQYEADNNFTSVDSTVWDRLPSIRQPVLLLDGSLVSGSDQSWLWSEAVDGCVGKKWAGNYGSRLASVVLTTVLWHHKTPAAPQALLLQLHPPPPRPPPPHTHTPTHPHTHRTHPFLPSMPA